MSIDQQSKAREIFVHCIRCEGRDERRSLLQEQSGGDEALAGEVLKLLEAFEENESFLEVSPAGPPCGDGSAPAVGVTLDSEPVDSAHKQASSSVIESREPGTQIGPYKIREKIAEGGMGAVYVAEQSKPVHRKVALKVIRPGMAGQNVVARFEAERQALAMMDHPNIARVLDGGSTDDQLPYFVMELVHGLPITEYCESKELTTRERLELVVDVCRAVQHAHQKGIIHRDLKPSNILVAEIDGKAVPKVIDFGVAKALHQRLTDQTVYTQFAQMVGTPLYMSPEQAGMGVIDVDTRSDVYSLGVVLYELLTGETPFDRERLKSVTFDEMRRIIREEQPKRPSHRISTVNARDRSTVADKQRRDARKLHRDIEGELDWIVLKALEKDRLRRYESASALATDVSCHLDNKPVEACPPSLVYQLRKYASRHKGLLTSAALLCISMLTGTLISIWYAGEAGRAAQQALAAESEADAARDRAESEAAIAKAVNDFVNEDLLAQANPVNEPNPNVTLREVVDRAAEEVAGSFVDQPLIEAAIRRTLATVYMSLGDYKQAQQHADRSLSLRKESLDIDDPNTLDSELMVATLQRARGDYRGSRQRLESLLTRARGSVGAEHSLTIKIMQSLTRAIRDDGDYLASEKLAKQTLELVQRVPGESHSESFETNQVLSDVYLRQGRYREAEGLQKKILDHRRRVRGEEHPDTLRSMAQLAELYRLQGRYREAEQLHVQTRDGRRRLLGDEHPETLTSMRNLADLYADRARFKEAEQLLDTVIQTLRRVLGGDHALTLVSKLDLAHVYRQQGRYEAAQRLYREIVETSRRVLGEQHPITLGSLNSQANLFYSQGRYDESEKAFNAVIEIARRSLGEEHPNTLASKHNLGGVYLKQRRYVEALRMLQIVFDSRRRLLGEEHPDTLASMSQLASAFYRQHRHNEAEQLLEAVIKIQRRVLGEEHPLTLDALGTLAQIYSDQGRYGEAAKLFSAVLAAKRRVLGDESPYTIASMNNLAIAYARQGRYRESVQLLETVVETDRRILGEEHPKVNIHMKNLALTCSDAAWSLSADVDDAEHAPDEAVEFARRATQLRPESAKHWNRLGVSLYRSGRWQEATEILDKADAMIEGGDREHRMFLAMAYWQTGERERAIKAYSEAAASIAIRTRVSDEQRRFQGEAEGLLGLSEEDRRDLILQHLDEMKPDDAEDFATRGKGYRSQGELERAIEDFTEAIRFKPREAQYWQARGSLRIRLDHLDEGQSDLAQALALVRADVESDPGSRQLWSKWCRIALSHYRLRDWQGAEQEADLAMELGADQPHLLTYSVPFYLLAGETETFDSVCRSMLVRWQSWEKEDLINLAAMCTLAADVPGGDAEQFMQMVQKAVDQGPGWTAEFAWLARCRIGDPQSTLGVAGQTLPGDPTIHKLVQTIANHQAGRVDIARSLLDEIIANWDETEPKYTSANLKREVLRKEAEQRLRQNSEPTPEGKRTTLNSHNRDAPARL